MAYKNLEDRKAYHRNWYAANKARRVQQIRDYQAREHTKFQDYKSGLKCSVCGYDRCARALEFHHLESEAKEADINKMLQHDKASFAKLLREMEKCLVLCANCHREVHDGLLKLPA